MSKRTPQALLLSAHKRGLSHVLPMTIGDRIRDARRKRGLTQRGLAKLVKVSPGAVAQWEGGGSAIRGPSITNLLTTARVLQMPPSQLLEDAPDRDQMVLVDPKEIALATLFQGFTPAQKEVHLALFYSSAGLSEPVKDESNPSDSILIPGTGIA